MSRGSCRSSRHGSLVAAGRANRHHRDTSAGTARSALPSGCCTRWGRVMTKLTLIDGASPPAKRTNKWKLLDDFIRDADYIVIRHSQLIEQRQELLRYVKVTDRDEYHTAPDMSDPALDEEEIETLAKCRAAITLLDPDENYDDEGNFRKAVISKRLAAMIGAYPAGTPSMPEVYAKMLLEHIATDVEIDYIILECSCREIERKQKFLPAISEVLKIASRRRFGKNVVMLSIALKRIRVRLPMPSGT